MLWCFVVDVVPLIHSTCVQTVVVISIFILHSVLFLLRIHYAACMGVLASALCQCRAYSKKKYPSTCVCFLLTLGGGRLALPYRFLLLLTPHPSLSRPFPSLSSHHGIMAKRSRAIKLPKGSGAEPGRQTTFKIGPFLVLWKCRLLSQLCEHQLPKASSCVHQYFCMNVRVTVLT